MGRSAPWPLLALLWAGYAAGASAVADGPGSAQAPQPAIAGELRQSSALLRTALDDALPRGVSVVEVETGYLTGQGVLVIADLARPWYSGEIGAIGIGAGITSLERIPGMVQEILQELDLGLSRHQVEDLQALHGLRHEQQAVRGEQRALRGELRALRRQRMAAGVNGAAVEVAELDRQLSALEGRLEAAAARERALELEANRKRDEVAAAPAAALPPPPAAALDRAVVRSVCGDAIGFATLDGDEHLNVVLRQAASSRYYVFALRQVRACQRGDIDAEELLAQSTSTSWR